MSTTIETIGCFSTFRYRTVGFNQVNSSGTIFTGNFRKIVNNFLIGMILYTFTSELLPIRNPFTTDSAITRQEVFARVRAHRIRRVIGMDEIIAEDKQEHEEHPDTWLTPEDE